MRTKRTTIVVAGALFFLLPITASAATISLHQTPDRVGVGDTVQVIVSLDSAIPANAFSGTLSYSASTLEPIAVSDGGSIVNLWVTRPAVPKAGMPITFAGITPGGFSGNKGTLFSILFRVTAAGSAGVSVADVQVLQNDGTGRAEPTTAKPLAFIIDPKSSGGYVEPGDTTPPEPFAVLLGGDPDLFAGRAYLVFTAVDKGSGIDHFSVAESRVPPFLLWLLPLSWHDSDSPYVMQDQGRTSSVYVKAVDRGGNERLVVFPPQHLFTPYEKAVLTVILIGVVLLWYIVRGRRPEPNP